MISLLPDAVMGGSVVRGLVSSWLLWGKGGEREGVGEGREEKETEVEGEGGMVKGRGRGGSRRNRMRRTTRHY